MKSALTEDPGGRGRSAAAKMRTATLGVGAVRCFRSRSEPPCCGSRWAGHPLVNHRRSWRGAAPREIDSDLVLASSDGTQAALRFAAVRIGRAVWCTRVLALCPRLKAAFLGLWVGRAASASHSGASCVCGPGYEGMRLCGFP